MKQIFRLLGVVLAVTLLPFVAGADEISIKIATPGTPPSLDNLYLQVAYEQGLFQKYGVKVSQLLQLRGGTLALQAVASGAADVTATDAESLMQAAQAGYAVRGVSAPAERLSYIIAVRKDINSFKDLTGKPFAVSRAGALSQYLMFPMLDKAGVARNSVQWVSVGSSRNRMLALLAGRVDGGLLDLEDALAAKSDPNVKFLVKVADIMPNYPHEILVVRKELIDQHPEAVTGIAAAIMEACRYIVTHKNGTLKVFQKYSSGTDPKIAEEVYDTLIGAKTFGVNGGMSEDNLKTAMNLAVENKFLDAPLPLEKWVDFRFQAEALKRLGGPVAE